MTVLELIKTLRKFPVDANVVVCDWNEDYAPPTALTCVAFNETQQVVTLQDPESKGE